MLLAVDVGNTHTVLGVYEGDRLVHDFRIESAKSKSVDEYHVLFLNLLSIVRLGSEQIHAAILASVVPPLTDTLVEAIDRAFDVETLLVGPGLKTGIPIHYNPPQDVGADRIVNAVAAYAWANQAVIVVDFGTATTFDCISDKGEYLGGAIVPGIMISSEALYARAAKLSKTEISKPPNVIGKNTAHSVQSGLIFGYVSLVDGLVEKLQAEMQTSCRVIATGGLASLMSEESTTIGLVDEFLTLEGLRLLFHKNQRAPSKKD